MIESILSIAVRFQQYLPVTLPNEYIAWRRYSNHFSKTCDNCHEEKGCYMISYQDRKAPSTVIYPVVFRLCTDCLCGVDEEVGIMEESEEKDASHEIERV